MEKYNEILLDHHYVDNIFLKNKEVILAGGTEDKFLGNALNDNRMSVVVLIRIENNISKAIIECINELRDIEPSLYYYPANDFHITVMDILRGEEGRTIPENIEEYYSCIADCAKEISPFHICFDGLTASDNAIMVRGYYEDGLQIFRQMLRDSFESHGLLLEERYETISSHITIARAKTGFNNPKRLIEFIEKEHYFGEMTVDMMEFSFHNWYDSQKEVLNTIRLAR